MEIWKDVVGYEGRYLVSNFGKVKSMPKPRCKREKILKSMLSKAGYLMVDLGDGKTIKRFLVHRLVAMAFIENPLNKQQVNHIDGNKCNNNLDNLEWNTSSENQLHSIRTGLRSAEGEKNSQSKLTKQQVLQIFNDTRMYKEISKDYNISIPAISNIKTGYSWSFVTGLKNMKKLIK